MEPRGRERHRWASREAEWSFWESDIEGKAAMVAASELGSERVSNERERMSQSFSPRASLQCNHASPRLRTPASHFLLLTSHLLLRGCDPLQRSRLKIQFAFCLCIRCASHLSPVI